MQQASQPNQSEASLHAMDYLQVVKNRYVIILITFFLVLITSIVITSLMQKKYESEAIMQIRPPTSIAPLGRGGDNVRNLTETQRFFDNQVEIIKSTNVLLRVVEKLGLAAKWQSTSFQAAGKLKAIVTVQNMRMTELVSITVRDTDKVDAKNIAEEVTKCYRDYRYEVENRLADAQLAELEKIVRDKRDDYENKRKNLEVIIRMKGIIPNEGLMNPLGSVADPTLTATGDAQGEFSRQERERIQYQGQIDFLSKLSSDELITYAAGLDLPESSLKTLFPQYQELKRSLDVSLTQLGDNHPNVVAQKRQILAMKNDLEAGARSLREVLKSKLAMIDQSLSKLRVLRDERKDDAVKKVLDTKEYQDARKEYETAFTNLTLLENRLTDERLNQRMPENAIEMHQAPEVSNAPVSPNVVLNISLGAVFGLVIGCAIAFVLEYLDTSVKSLEDVERYLQVPVLAIVPKDVGILYQSEGRSPDEEAYRILRTNLEFSRKDPSANSVTVVSGGAGEGKSTTLINLAYVCAQGGYTTLVIDGDLRRPRMHSNFNVNNQTGLVNFLSGEAKLEDVIMKTKVENLYFMPSGRQPNDSSSVLNSRRMARLMQEVKQRFDLVLVDSPPILGISDASVLVNEVDLTIIVVQHGKLPRNMLMRVKKAVESVGGKVVGVVLNNVDIRSDSQYQYYTSYYTYYSVASETDEKDAKKPVAKNDEKDTALY